MKRQSLINHILENDNKNTVNFEIRLIQRQAMNQIMNEMCINQLEDHFFCSLTNVLILLIFFSFVLESNFP